MPIMLFVILALIFVILLIVVTNIVIVPQSMVYVVERLGSYSATCPSCLMCASFPIVPKKS